VFSAGLAIQTVGIRQVGAAEGTSLNSSGNLLWTVVRSQSRSATTTELVVAEYIVAETDKSGA